MLETKPVLYLFQTRMNEIIVYYDGEKYVKKSKAEFVDPLTNLKGKKTYSGDMTIHSRRRMKRTIECLYMISKKKRVFNSVLRKYTWFHLSHITLTLSSAQGQFSDKVINKDVLQPFLRDCKRKFGMSNYVWKAEKQLNNNVHYHIISDMFIDIQLLRKVWNNHQNTLGLIDQFTLKHGHNNPNSTDIHYVKSDKAITRYLMKYLAKNERKDLKIEGKVWDCSKLLKGFKYHSTDLSSKEFTQLEKTLDSIEHKRFDSDYFSILQFANSNYIDSMPPTLRNQHLQQYLEIATLNNKSGISPNLNF